MALSKKLLSYLRMNKRLSHHINTKKWILQGICKNTKMNTDAKDVLYPKTAV